MQDGKAYIFVGHYGSGKTEFAVNFAYRLLSQGRNVAVADMDIVNPYFRSRELAESLEADGIKIVSNNFSNDNLIDAPALSAAIAGCFTDRTRDNVMDVGGDAVGARVLARFNRSVKEYEMWLVVNFNRYKTEKAEDVLEYIEGIQQNSGLTITGLINNTHCLRDTKKEDVLKGDKEIRRLSKMIDLPVRYCSYLNVLEDDLSSTDLAGVRFPVDLRFRPTWFMN